MQTKQQIEQLLASAGVNPNKRHGQHFLIDLNLMRLLVQSAHLSASDVVLEVGCGTGSMTEELISLAGFVVAVEIDPVLTKITRKQLADAGNIAIIEADVLKGKNTINQSVLEAVRSAVDKTGGRFLLVANLPYNVASSVMLNLVNGPLVADSMYATVQKEVADRMTARPNTEDYGTLSIILGVAGDTKIIRNLKPTVFWPPPQVDSAMISFNISREKMGRIRDMELFGDVVELFMGHRRKMLKACAKFAAGRLAGIHNWGNLFKDCAIDPHLRPEQLKPDEYVNIANKCHEQMK